MKAKTYYEVFLTVSLFCLLWSPLFAQNSDVPNSKDDVLNSISKDKQETVSLIKGKNHLEIFTKEKTEASQENKNLDINVQNAVDKSITYDITPSSSKSYKVDQIEFNVETGELITDTLTIQNTGNSPLIWNVISDGNQKLLFRKYIKDRNLLGLNDTQRQEKENVLSAEIFAAKETMEKMKSKSNKKLKEIPVEQHLLKKKDNINENDLINLSNKSNTLLIHDDVDLSGRLELNRTNKTKEISFQKNNKPGVYSTDFSDGLGELLDEKISHDNENRVSKNDRLAIFKQWFKFSDRTKPIFNPQIEVWEVSGDNGIHWMQILFINGESYVTNAKNFDPNFYLEENIIRKRNSPYSNLILLSDFEKQVKPSPTFSPESGIIPANSSGDIEFEINTTSLEKGTYNSQIILTDAISMETIEVIPLQLDVISQSKNEVVNKLDKQVDDKQIPDKSELSQNYPNPFNSATIIKYDLSKASSVTIRVYDILGREVALLVDEQQQAGNYQISFDASSLSSGTYFYRIQAGDFVETKKMILMK